MKPVRDDALAAQFCPVFVSDDPVIAIYYRAAVDESNGLVHIAYHPVWEREVNTSLTISGWLTRHLYTGGLSLQRFIYGPKDIECVGVTIDASAHRVVSIEYETTNASSDDLFVRHDVVQEAEKHFELPLRFRVISWNHLFARTSAARSAEASTELLAYFTPELWEEYAMVKHPETIFKRNRAHFEWEREV